MGLSGGLVIGLIGGPTGGLIGGLSGAPEVRERVVPNQGVWLSARNGLKIGLIGGLLSGLIVGLGMGLLSGSSFGLNAGIAAGVFGGVTVGVVSGLGSGLSYGGLVWLQHFTTRFLLGRSNPIPYNYIPFLDYAADCILLQRVGPGYRFIHRIVQEYLATQGEREG